VAKSTASSTTRAIRGRVRQGHAGQVGGHVGNHKVDLSPRQASFQLGQHRLVQEVALDEVDVGDRLHRQQVQRHDPPVQPGVAGAREPLASTCDQLPGALPRSTIVMPGRMRGSCSSISISLNAARER
jgi:hypothetical protein